MEHNMGYAIGRFMYSHGVSHGRSPPVGYPVKNKAAHGIVVTHGGIPCYTCITYVVECHGAHGYIVRCPMVCLMEHPSNIPNPFFWSNVCASYEGSPCAGHLRGRGVPSRDATSASATFTEIPRTSAI